MNLSWGFAAASGPHFSWARTSRPTYEAMRWPLHDNSRGPYSPEPQPMSSTWIEPSSRSMAAQGNAIQKRSESLRLGDAPVSRCGHASARFGH